MNRQGFDAGIKAASEYLIKTAEDYEQLFPMRLAENAKSRARGDLGWYVALSFITEDQNKAVMLRGQADNLLRDLIK